MSTGCIDRRLSVRLQKFAEELFKRLNKATAERFEVRLVMMSVISRVTGVHKLLLLNFYPFLQKYVLPHQRDAPTLLAVLVQVPPPPLPVCRRGASTLSTILVQASGTPHPCTL